LPLLIAALGALLWVAWPSVLDAGTTGKLAGRVLDKQKQPLPGANVLLVGTPLGAATDLEGYYTILNIASGTYRVQFSYVGYQSLVVQEVLISADKTTTLNAELEESVIATEAVVVKAERPVVEVNLTSSVQTVTTENISVLPVQELREVVNLQAGVVEGHFRGGRLGEVQYQINGVTINNPYDNSSTLRIDRSLLQEVQVISGTFDAEYGQAMSGVVNAVLKSGSDRFHWNGEAYAGDFLYPGGRRIVSDRFRPMALQNYQLSLSGPTPLPQTFFVVSGRRYVFDDYFFGRRRFVPTDSSDFERKIFKPSGDNQELPLGYSREWSGLVKITNRSLKNIEVAYQAIWNVLRGRRANFAYRLIPDALPKQKTLSIVHGLDWTHTLSARSFYNLSLRENYFDYKDYVYESVFDPRYLAAGRPRGDANYELGAIVQGVDLTRFLQRTDSYVLKGALTTQVSRAHQIKIGGEVQSSKVRFGSPGYIVATTISGLEVLRPVIAQPPDYPPVSQYRPLSFAVYGQDQIEWHDLTLRAGLRTEYFDARATVPSDPANPANAIAGAPLSFPKRTSKKITVAPRLGVSYPITDRSAIFFAYGHFYQMPGLGQIFDKSDYTVLARLQAGGISYGVMGNPDIKPERTVQYEFGYKHALTDFLGLDVDIFYKDIRDLLGVEFVSTYTAAEYARLTNVDFGNVMGFTLALDQRQVGPISSTLNYTWQRAQGNASDPRETAVRASAGEDPRPRQVPFDWDQRHTLNLTLMLAEPANYAISAIVRFGSGQPYTPAIGSGFGASLETNSGRKKNAVVVDLRAEKNLPVAGLDLRLFARVFNLFDTRFFNGFVFADTGSPFYSLNPAGTRALLADPTRFYPPRRVEVGLAVNSPF